MIYIEPGLYLRRHFRIVGLFPERCDLRFELDSVTPQRVSA